MKNLLLLFAFFLLVSPLFSQENNFQFLKNGEIGMNYQIGSYIVKPPAAGNFEVWGYRMGVEYHSKFSKHFGAVIFAHAGAGDTFNEESPRRFISGGLRGAGLALRADVLNPEKKVKIKLSVGAVYNQFSFHGDAEPKLNDPWSWDYDFVEDRSVFNMMGSLEIGCALPKGFTLLIKESLAWHTADFHYALVGISLSKKI